MWTRKYDAFLLIVTMTVCIHIYTTQAKSTENYITLKLFFKFIHIKLQHVQLYRFCTLKVLKWQATTPVKCKAASLGITFSDCSCKTKTYRNS